MMSKYYLAYGSNLNIRQMAYRCPTAVPVGIAVIKDYRLKFKGSKTGSYLTIEKAKGYEVPVAVWKVEDDDELHLDCYEGYPTFYYKKELTLPIKGIKTGKVRNRNVYVYIMHEDRPIGIPSNQYVRTCLEGYRDFGFDISTLRSAYEFSRKEFLK